MDASCEGRRSTFRPRPCAGCARPLRLQEAPASHSAIIDRPGPRGEYPAMTAPSRPTPAVHRAARSPAVRRVLQVILVLNAIVVGIKLAVGIRTGALSVLGATLESALDMFNNVMGMVLTGLAAREPDDDHPYGHEKFETLGALAIVGFLSISCFELLRAGAVQVIRGGEPHSAGLLE